MKKAILFYPSHYSHLKLFLSEHIEGGLEAREQLACAATPPTHTDSPIIQMCLITSFVTVWTEVEQFLQDSRNMIRNNIRCYLKQ